MCDFKVTGLSGQTEKHFDQLEHTVEHKAYIIYNMYLDYLRSEQRLEDEKLHKRVDELTGKCEATFESLLAPLRHLNGPVRHRRALGSGGPRGAGQADGSSRASKW